MAGERVFTEENIQDIRKNMSWFSYYISLFEDSPQEFLKNIGVLDENGEIVHELKPEFKLKGLYRDNPKTPEGKYLVLRRDGSIVDFPLFVLGARDPYAAKTLVKYAEFLQEGLDNGDPNIEQSYIDAIMRWSRRFDEYRSKQGPSKPCCSGKVKDCPAIIALMKKGESA